MVLFCPLSINQYIQVNFPSRFWPCSLFHRFWAHAQFVHSGMWVCRKWILYTFTRTNPGDLLQSHLPWAATPWEGTFIPPHRDVPALASLYRGQRGKLGKGAGSWGCHACWALSSHSLGRCHATGCHSLGRWHATGCLSGLAKQDIHGTADCSPRWPWSSQRGQSV